MVVRHLETTNSFSCGPNNRAGPKLGLMLLSLGVLPCFGVLTRGMCQIQTALGPYRRAGESGKINV
jgi:hypothetical protein